MEEDTEALMEAVSNDVGPDSVFLLMSSGRFGGTDLAGAIEAAATGA